jgi:hypothetical protein
VRVASCWIYTSQPQVVVVWMPTFRRTMLLTSSRWSVILRNFGILQDHYTTSQPEDGGSKALRNIGILLRYYTLSQPEDGCIKVLRNFGILPHHCTVSQPEDGGSKALRNFGILPHHCTVSQPRRSWLESSWPWKPQVSLHTTELKMSARGSSSGTVGRCFPTLKV